MTIEGDIMMYSRGVLPAIGRNGLTKALGIVVTSEEGGIVSINPYNTQGRAGKAGIPVPIEDLPELITLLQKVVASQTESND